MTIRILGETPKTTRTQIIPLSKHGSLSSSLQKIAARFNIPETMLTLNFMGDAKEIHSIYTENQHILLLGIGEKTGYAELKKAFIHLVTKWKEKFPDKIALNLSYSNMPSSEAAIWAKAATNGIGLGSYNLGLYKTNGKKPTNFEKKAQLTIVSEKSLHTEIKKAATQGNLLAQTQMQIFNLVNAPANKAKPEVLAKWAINSGKKYGYKVTSLTPKQIEKTGLHGVLAVNRGSEYPPAFVIMEYKPKKVGKKTLPKIGIVGKGVTFDTGGISLKGSKNMHYMKSDMGGAAAVLGTMEMVAKLKLPVHLIGIVPSTDNCIDALAIKPGDIINSYSGKTIEIIDTDAEGRLLLADGLAYMVKHFNPEIMIDLATLTGSCVRTLGYQAAALLSKNEILSANLYKSGLSTGEKLWPLPLWDCYKKDIESDVADIRNFSGRPVAGAISAGKFLEFFTNNHPCWAHLDIAGVAFGDTDFGTMKAATGFGIQLLTDFVTKTCEHA